jgi:hypothetical protein
MVWRMCNSTALAQNAGGVQWFTTGTGSFSPAADVANAVYTPTANDSIVGGVYLILTGFGTGTCGNTSDSLFVDIGPTRIANAGNDQTICADGDPIQLNGAITGVTGGVWSTTGTGTFLPDNTTLGAAYVPSATDLVFGELEFILTTTGNLGCPADVDTMTVALQQVPTVNAGQDINVCDASEAVQLGASSTGAAGVLWSSNGSGVFLPSNTDLECELPARRNGRATRYRAHDPHHHRQRCVCCGERYVVPQLHQSTASQLSVSAMLARDPRPCSWMRAPRAVRRSSDGTGASSNGASGTGPQDSTTFDTPGQYTATLTVFAQNGCSARARAPSMCWAHRWQASRLAGELFTDSPIASSRTLLGGPPTGSTTSVMVKARSLRNRPTNTRSRVNTSSCKR